MENKRTSAALLPLVVILLHSHLAYCLELPDYQTKSFTNPSRNSEFTKLTVHNETGDIFIGGGNALYRLAADFSRQESVDTAVDCDEHECSVNYNKILLVDYVDDMLITCGSEKYGSCQTRALNNIAEPLREDDTPVVTSGKLSTEAIIAPGPENHGVNTLYVAATYNNERYNALVYPVTRRTLSASTDTDRMFNVERGAQLLLNRDNFYSNEFIINYISAFVKETHYNEQTHRYTYFVTTQRKDLEENNLFDRNYVSKINRVCQQGHNFHSYMEIVLNCTTQSDNYNLIQAAYVGPAGHNLAQSLGLNDGDDVFYGVFAKQEGIDGYIPSSKTALCVYKLEDIEEKFIDGIYGCLKDGGEFDLRYLQGSDCPGVPWATRDYAEGQQCSAASWTHADGYNALVSTPVLEWTHTQPSSIITAIHRNHTIAYVGTAEGDLVKVHLENGKQGREYERFPLGSPVLRDAHVDEAQEMVTLLTEQKLFKLRVENCRAYTTCYECIGVNGGEDGDPYCGWCTLEKRCTRYDVCPMSDVYTRWLPYNSAHCIDISNVVPYGHLPITISQQLIILTVEPLPDLSGGHTYQCMFGNTPPSAAIKYNNRLTCLTPAGFSIPKIQSGNDYVTMQLYVISTETDVKFVQRDFYFYECSTHQMCVACTNSSWACDWCIYSNTCTHESSSTCSDDVSGSIINGINNPVISNIQGYEECPQLAAQNVEILVPDGVSKPIKVTGVNLPDLNRATSYKCILNIEGDNVETDATSVGDILTCGARMYTYRATVSTLDVDLSVVWNNNRRLDDLYGFKVTLYKCGVGRPDCSRCLSNLSTRPGLNCGWCSMDNKCTTQGSSDCSGGWMSSATNINCPNPYLSELQPPSGPLNGNTIIAISGTDLGKKFSDITAIKVGTKDCNKNGLEDRYIAGSSVSCRTMSGTNNSVEDITVTIKGANGNPQKSTGEVQFTYRDPSISSFDPRKGLTAGGTVVTISGQYLDACSEISATIGSECIMNRMDDVINTTTVRCRTTSSPAGTSHKVTVSFDGTERQSDEEFTYRPNPIISAVLPLKTIESGGIILTVRGTGFELSQTPQMVIYIGDEQFKEDCLVLNNTIMLCKTPNSKAASDILRRQREAVGLASFGFIIGDVSSLLRWSDDNNASMQYFADPEYDLFGTKSKSGDLELIMGKNLKDASSIKDVTVYIGTVKAITISLTQNTLLIELPKKNPGRECINGNRTRDPCVIVYHGNLMFYLGMLRYPAGSSNLTITLISCMMVVLVVLIISMLVCYVIRYKRLLKNRDVSILERLRLLQKLVEEEIDNLAAESSHAQSFVILPNNVQINSQDVKIRYSDLSIGRKLGHGAFGEVFHAILTTGGMSHQVAVKSIQGNQDASTIVQFLEEGLIMKDFDHPNVLGLVGLTFDPDGNPLVVLPFMINGDLRSFMKNTTVEITSKQKLNFAIEAAKGMAYLTKKKFVHRDIAARNCMVDDKLVVKIGDFGRSRDMEEADYYTSRDMKAKLPVKWMAPESLDKRVYNEKTDVWSYGVLLWEIFTNGKKPYRTIANKDVYYYITSGNRLPCPEDCREDIYDIMMQCWKSNPKERIGFQELSLRFITVSSLYTYAWTDEEPGLIGEQGISNMHPLEERKVQDDESSSGNTTPGVTNDKNDGHGTIYENVHPVEGNNEAVSIEMQNMNPM